MDFQTLDQRLENVIGDLQTGAYGEVMAEVALSALALVRSRVQETGADPSGGKYKDYSPDYKKFKQQAGKYKGHVDFSFSNRMWNNIKLASPEGELTTGVAVITATTPDDKKKLEWNVDRRGEILALSEEEKREIADIYNEGILNIFRRNGL